jgi:hypothetical protein
LALVVVVALLFGWVVMVSWNIAVPGLLHLPAITYGQAVAVLILVRLLTGRFTHGSHWRHRRHCCARPGESANLFSTWWEEEGEAAFKDYSGRQGGEKQPD